MPIIYRKTAKGLAEIETRVYRLSPRLRSVLIVVDGKRSDDELAAMIPQAPESLEALRRDDFIEVLATLADVVLPTLPPPSAPAAPPAPGPAPAAAAPPPHPRYEAMRRDLLRAFIDRVGPAGETLAIKLERARSEADFRALLPQAVQLIGTIQGRGAAESFQARIDAW